MSTRIKIEVHQDAVTTYGGRTVRPEGSLQIEIDPHDVRGGHSAIAALAESAHDELRRAVNALRGEPEAEA